MFLFAWRRFSLTFTIAVLLALLVPSQAHAVEWLDKLCIGYTGCGAKG